VGSQPPRRETPKESCVKCLLSTVQAFFVGSAFGFLYVNAGKLLNLDSPLKVVGVTRKPKVPNKTPTWSKDKADVPVRDMPW